MYKVQLLAKEDYEIKSIEDKSLLQAVNVFDGWLKEDAFDGEVLLLWDNDNLIKKINVRKKSDWRHGETYNDIVDGFTENAPKPGMISWKPRNGFSFAPGYKIYAPPERRIASL